MKLFKVCQHHDFLMHCSGDTDPTYPIAVFGKQKRKVQCFIISHSSDVFMYAILRAHDCGTEWEGLVCIWFCA